MCVWLSVLPPATGLNAHRSSHVGLTSLLRNRLSGELADKISAVRPMVQSNHYVFPNRLLAAPRAVKLGWVRRVVSGIFK